MSVLLALQAGGGPTIVEADGAAAGTSTADGIGAAIWNVEAASAGAGVADGAGAAVWAGVASSDGVATVVGEAAAIAAADAAAAGVGEALGVSAAIAEAVASASGTSEVSGDSDYVGPPTVMGKLQPPGAGEYFYEWWRARRREAEASMAARVTSDSDVPQEDSRSLNEAPAPKRAAVELAPRTVRRLDRAVSVREVRQIARSLRGLERVLVRHLAELAERAEFEEDEADIEVLLLASAGVVVTDAPGLAPPEGDEEVIEVLLISML